MRPPSSSRHSQIQTSGYPPTIHFGMWQYEVMLLVLDKTRSEKKAKAGGSHLWHFYPSGYPVSWIIMGYSKGFQMKYTKWWLQMIKILKPREKWIRNDYFEMYFGHHHPSPQISWKNIQQHQLVQTHEMGDGEDSISAQAALYSEASEKAFQTFFFLTAMYLCHLLPAI